MYVLIKYIRTLLTCCLVTIINEIKVIPQKQLYLYWWYLSLYKFYLGHVKKTGHVGSRLRHLYWIFSTSPLTSFIVGDITFLKSNSSSFWFELYQFKDKVTVTFNIKINLSAQFLMNCFIILKAGCQWQISDLCCF